MKKIFINIFFYFNSILTKFIITDKTLQWLYNINFKQSGFVVFTLFYADRQADGWTRRLLWMLCIYISTNLPIKTSKQLYSFNFVSYFQQPKSILRETAHLKKYLTLNLDFRTSQWPMSAKKSPIITGGIFYLKVKIYLILFWFRF